MMLNLLKGGPYLFLQNKRRYSIIVTKRDVLWRHTGLRKVYGVGDDAAPVQPVQHFEIT